MSSSPISRRSTLCAPLLALGLAAPALQARADAIVDATPPVYTQFAVSTMATGIDYFAPVAMGPDGLMYGTAFEGGSEGGGTVFRVEANGTPTVLHSFYNDGLQGVQPTSGLVLGTDGWLYGTTPASTPGAPTSYGSVYKISAKGKFAVVHAFSAADGVGSPNGALVQGADGSFYGTSTGSGAKHGAVFKVGTDGQFTLVYKFKNGADAGNPSSPLLLGRNGLFYGLIATDAGGSLYSLSTDGHMHTVHTFVPATDGCAPGGNLVQASDGEIYGTATNCGSMDEGTLFGVTPQGVFEVVHTFGAADPLGIEPRGGLAIDAGGSLYGTAYKGGGPNGHMAGTVYSMTRSGVGRLFHAFTNLSTDGSYPVAAPTIAAGNLLYGTTSYGGGDNAEGTVFKVQLPQ